jgi:hypothetical protein
MRKELFARSLLPKPSARLVPLPGSINEIAFTNYRWNVFRCESRVRIPLDRFTPEHSSCIDLCASVRMSPLRVGNSAGDDVVR